MIPCIKSFWSLKIRLSIKFSIYNQQLLPPEMNELYTFIFLLVCINVRVEQRFDITNCAYAYGNFCSIINIFLLINYLRVYLFETKQNRKVKQLLWPPPSKAFLHLLYPHLFLASFVMFVWPLCSWSLFSHFPSCS